MGERGNSPPVPPAPALGTSRSGPVSLRSRFGYVEIRMLHCSNQKPVADVRPAGEPEARVTWVESEKLSKSSIAIASNGLA
jgi:hypothetical protein